MTGFNDNGKSKREEHPDYLGKAGNFTNQQGGVVGVYRGVERDSHGVNYAIFNPSIIFSQDNRPVIETSLSSKLMMPLIVLRPIAGTLEEWVASANPSVKDSAEPSAIPPSVIDNFFENNS